MNINRGNLHFAGTVIKMTDAGVKTQPDGISRAGGLTLNGYMTSGGFPIQDPRTPQQREIEDVVSLVASGQPFVYLPEHGNGTPTCHNGFEKLARLHHLQDLLGPDNEIRQATAPSRSPEEVKAMRDHAFDVWAGLKLNGEAPDKPFGPV